MALSGRNFDELVEHDGFVAFGKPLLAVQSHLPHRIVPRALHNVRFHHLRHSTDRREIPNGQQGLHRSRGAAFRRFLPGVHLPRRNTDGQGTAEAKESQTHRVEVEAARSSVVNAAFK